MINTHNGIKTSGVKPVNINDYPSIKNHLDQYIIQLTKRGDKGDTPYNLRNCAYINEFSKPKIVYPELTAFQPFVFDETGYMIDKTSFILTATDSSISLKMLCAILNSKLCKLWFWYKCPEIMGGTRVLGKTFLETLCIPSVTIEQQEDICTFADKMLSLNKELQEKRSRFLRRLTENLEGVKITTALQTFDKLTFAGFVAELKKQKIKLSLSQQDEWEDYFNNNASACQALSQQISETDNEIDTRVFDLYGLTQEEREIVIKN